MKASSAAARFATAVEHLRGSWIPAPLRAAPTAHRRPRAVPRLPAADRRRRRLSFDGPVDDLLLSGDIVIREMEFRDRMDWEATVSRSAEHG